MGIVIFSKSDWTIRSIFSQPSLWLSVAGVLLVVGALVSYSSLVSTIEVSSSSLTTLGNAAYEAALAVSFGAAMVVTGLTVYLRRFPDTNTGRISSTLSDALRNRFSSRTFVATSVSYGLLFALMSGTLVIRPGASFSQTYGVGVPSILPVVCCGSLGQIPQVVIYATQQVALLIVPLNLVLLVGISWLVGVNSALAAFAFKSRPQSSARWLTGIGATVGLFSACPTCAGLFLWTSANVSGALTATIAAGSLQGLFVILSLPLLVSTIFVMSRQLSLRACTVSARGPDRVEG